MEVLAVFYTTCPYEGAKLMALFDNQTDADKAVAIIEKKLIEKFEDMYSDAPADERIDFVSREFGNCFVYHNRMRILESLDSIENIDPITL